MIKFGLSKTQGMIREKLRIPLSIITLIILNCSTYSQGYEIKLNAPDFAGQDVILAEYFTSRMVPKDTLTLNIMGEGVFSGSETFDGGLYVLYFNPKYYFDVMIDKDQSFTIRTDSSDFAKKTSFEGSTDNSLFFEYKQYLTEMKKKQELINEKLVQAKNNSDSLKVNVELEQLNETMENYIDKMIAINEGSFFTTFLKAMKEKQAPESMLAGTQRQKDSIKYVYYKDHFFDNFDLADVRLLHTPLYEPKIKTYINRVVPQFPDSIIVAVDMLIEKSRADEAIFRYMLITLFNNFAESKLMGMDKVYFHIAEKYYIPEASWSTQDFIDKLKDNLKKSKPTFIGNSAPDFEIRGIPKEHFLMANMDSVIKKDPHVGYTFLLSQIEADYILLYFWEADCGHCQKSTPILYDVFKKYENQNVEVIAVHVINSVEGKEKWIDFVNEHELLDWINCWSPYSNDFRNDYNLLSFPQLYLLDKDKKILAKGLSPEQADEILDRFLKK
jgi:thiol-disulfide isomerase/thioredoxin